MVGWTTLKRGNCKGVDQDLEWRLSISGDDDLRPMMRHEGIAAELCRRSEMSEWGGRRRECEHSAEERSNDKPSMGTFEASKENYAQC